MATTFTPDLLVSDVDRASRFLQQALGFKELERMGPPGKPVWAMLMRDTSRIMIEAPASDDPDTKALVARTGGKLGATVHFYLSVDDLQGEVARLDAAHVEHSAPVDKPYGMREIALHDADGYSWMIGQRVTSK